MKIRRYALRPSLMRGSEQSMYNEIRAHYSWFDMSGAILLSNGRGEMSWIKEGQTVNGTLHDLRNRMSNRMSMNSVRLLGIMEEAIKREA